MLTRRGFIESAAASVTAAAVARGLNAQPAAAPAAPPRPLKIGAVTYNIARDWDLEAILRNLPAAGIEAVELRTTHAHGVEPSLSPAARRDVRERFAASPVRLTSLGTTCEYHAADPSQLRPQIAETAAWVELAADVGAASVKVRPNGLR